LEIPGKIPPTLHVEPERTWTYQANSTGVATYRSSDHVAGADFDFIRVERPIQSPENVPLLSRSTRFGLAAGERFAVEGFITALTTTESKTVNLGGLEGIRALQEGDTDTPTSVRPIFSLDQVADKFLEEFYFETELFGATVRIRFYYLVE
jgi:hypothetical protein